LYFQKISAIIKVNLMKKLAGSIKPKPDSVFSRPPRIALEYDHE